MSDGPPPVLDYGHAEPVGRRVLRHIPRASVLTVFLLILAAIFDMWFYSDHQVWVIEHSCHGGAEPLNTRVTADGVSVQRRIFVAPGVTKAARVVAELSSQIIL